MNSAARVRSAPAVPRGRTRQPSITPAPSAPSAARACAADRRAAVVLGRARRRGRRAGPVRGAAARATRSTNAAAGHRRNGLPALDVDDDDRWRVGSTPAAASRATTAARAAGVDRHLGRVAFGVRRRRSPSARSRSHWFTTECRGRSSRGRAARARCTSSCGPARRSRCAAARRVAHVSSELRGPPWKSSTRSKPAAPQPRAPAPGRRAAAPRRVRPGRDDHLVEVRVAGDDRRGVRLDQVGEAGVRERRRSARKAGVVKTTSPIRRRRISRIFTGLRGRRRRQSSTVASSSSITGMSSLTG